MSSKTLILITGANQGLGYYAAQQLASEGKYHVFVGSRDFSKAEKAIESLVADDSVKVDANDLEPIQIDIDDDASIKAAAETIDNKYHKLDILLNNAAIALPEEEAFRAGGSTLREFYRRHYETNVFGTAAAAEAFIPLLRKGEKRLAFTSSSVGSLHAATEENLVPGVSLNGLVDHTILMAGANNLQAYVVYRSTKSALNMIMVQYAKQLEGEGFIVSASNPGYCATNLNAYSGLKDPREGAKALIRCATGAKEDVHCLMVNENGTEPW
jgi:NAD(P)-dependent dehydrogenase (short-subunit alcohol dehydrogenase family)